jgi:hypothetical protein
MKSNTSLLFTMRIGALLLVLSSIFLLENFASNRVEAAASVSCHQITANSGMVDDTSLAPPWNVFSSANQLLVSAFCSDDAIEISVGGDSAFEYVYSTGYVYDKGWKPFTLQGENPDNSNGTTNTDWIVASGRAELQPSDFDLSEPNYFITYSCRWSNNQWNCGCEDANCEESKWQIQAFGDQETVSTPAAIETPTQADDQSPSLGGITVDYNPDDWELADMTWFESYPTSWEEAVLYNGAQWEGMFAGVNGKQTEEWVKARNIAAVHSQFFQEYRGKTFQVRNRETGKVLEVEVLDMCADSDCDGCCTRNMENSGFLIDLEKYTAQRFFDGPATNAVIEWRCIDCD